jgi:hypothetical protein
METALGGSPQGVIRFDLEGGDPIRFATNIGPIDLYIGLDGLLYTLSRGSAINAGGNRVDVFDPQTMAFIRTLTLPQEHRAIAADFNGDIYTAQRDPVSRINRFSPAGLLVDSINDPGVAGFGDIDINRHGGVLVTSHGGSLVLTTTALDDAYFFTTRNPAGTNFAAWIEAIGPEPMRDFNGNGTVDAADYVLWRDMLGQVASGLAADANGNGVVELFDYDLWRADFGRPAATEPADSFSFIGSASVPEPPLAISLAVIVASALATRLAPLRPAAMRRAQAPKHL